MRVTVTGGAIYSGGGGEADLTELVVINARGLDGSLYGRRSNYPALASFDCSEDVKMKKKVEEKHYFSFARKRVKLESENGGEARTKYGVLIMRY